MLKAKKINNSKIKVTVTIDYIDSTVTIYSFSSPENNFSERSFTLNKFLNSQQVIQFKLGKKRTFLI